MAQPHSSKIFQHKLVQKKKVTCMLQGRNTSIQSKYLVNISCPICYSFHLTWQNGLQSHLWRLRNYAACLSLWALYLQMCEESVNCLESHFSWKKSRYHMYCFSCQFKLWVNMHIWENTVYSSLQDRPWSVYVITSKLLEKEHGIIPLTL